ncbi:hypothetical protein [Synechococcus sp. MU1655]|uniref:hypothetical protein n=1 Tax=Synechococcus sp. MU1655 TaxID=2508355 RepID=UPI0020268F75|nr:hypothetical protein [Synechococcus sp. MU1655]
MFAFGEIVFEGLIWNQAGFNAVIVNFKVLSFSRGNPLMELINDHWCHHALLGMEDKFKSTFLMGVDSFGRFKWLI